MDPRVIAVFVPIVGSVALFSFLSVAVWTEGQRKEREAFYKAETLRRITEASGEGAKEAIELLREEARLKRIKAREGLKIAGLINMGVGIALLIFLGMLAGSPPHGTQHLGFNVALCGLIPGLIGVAMLVYVYALAGPVEPPETGPTAR